MRPRRTGLDERLMWVAANQGTLVCATQEAAAKAASRAKQLNLTVKVVWHPPYIAGQKVDKVFFDELYRNGKQDKNGHLIDDAGRLLNDPACDFCKRTGFKTEFPSHV